MRNSSKLGFSIMKERFGGKSAFPTLAALLALSLTSFRPEMQVLESVGAGRAAVKVFRAQLSYRFPRMR